MTILVRRPYNAVALQIAKGARVRTNLRKVTTDLAEAHGKKGELQTDYLHNYNLFQLLPTLYWQEARLCDYRLPSVEMIWYRTL